jgi:autotransporter adhesin
MNSVAIGAGSRTSAADTVSFGGGFTGPTTRTLTNVTAGVANSDVVVMSQLNVTNTALATNTAADVVTNTRITTANTNVTNLTTTINAIVLQAAGMGTLAATLQTEINGNSNNIATNSQAIIDTNFALVTTNTNVATNATNIATNTAAIATNAQAIVDTNIAVTTNTANIASTNGILATTTATTITALGIANNSVQYDNAGHSSATVTGNLNIQGNIIGQSSVVAIGENAIIMVSGTDSNGGVDRITTDGNAPGSSDIHIGGNALDNVGNVIAGKTVNVVIEGGLTVSANKAVSMGDNKITKVGAGTTTTDAVNYGQLVTTNGLVATNTANIATNISEISKLNELMNGTQTQINGLQNQVTQNNRDALQGIAGIAAMSGLPALETGKRFNLGMGVGNYRSESAIAIGAQARIAENMVVKVSVGASGSNYATSVGVGISW